MTPRARSNPADQGLAVTPQDVGAGVTPPFPGNAGHHDFNLQMYHQILQSVTATETQAKELCRRMDKAEVKLDELSTSVTEARATVKTAGKIIGGIALLIAIIEGFVRIVPLLVHHG